MDRLKVLNKHCSRFAFHVDGNQRKRPAATSAIAKLKKLLDTVISAEFFLLVAAASGAAGTAVAGEVDSTPVARSFVG